MKTQNKLKNIAQALMTFLLLGAIGVAIPFAHDSYNNHNSLSGKNISYYGVPSVVYAAEESTTVPETEMAEELQNNKSVVISVVDENGNETETTLKQNIYNEEGFNIEYRPYQPNENGENVTEEPWRDYEFGVDLLSEEYEIRLKDTKKELSDNDIAAIISLMNLNDEIIERSEQEVDLNKITTINTTKEVIEQPDTKNYAKILLPYMIPAIAAVIGLILFLAFTKKKMTIQGSLDIGLAIGINAKLNKKDKIFTRNGEFRFMNLKTGKYQLSIVDKSTKEEVGKIEVSLSERKSKCNIISSEEGIQINALPTNDGITINVRKSMKKVS